VTFTAPLVPVVCMPNALKTPPAACDLMTLVPLMVAVVVPDPACELKCAYGA
jgi:hypothetical protein